MQQEIKPIVKFDFDIDLHEDEISMKGYCDNVQVRLPDSSTYNVVFYDIVRLGQDLQDETYIAEAGLIVLKEISRLTIEHAVCEAWLDGFFENLKPLI